MHIIQAVPTNIITGFLGVGKTTAINHLLKSKPADERWAVLVNEFGEVGVDASLLNGQNQPKNGEGESQGVFIKEVAGGCMCCTSGLSMQVALNVLLTQAKPHRLLIEPTGLGHPKEVLQTLTEPHYQKVVQLGATITLVDARNLRDPRYTNNDTFNQQLQVADIIAANKTDLYDADDLGKLKQYCQTITDAPIQTITQAKLDWQWLLQDNKFAQKTEKNSGKVLIDTGLKPFSIWHIGAQTSNQQSGNQQSGNQENDSSLDVTPALPACGYAKITNQQDGFTSVGWRFAPHFVFNRTDVSVLLSAMTVLRAKAVFITADGVFGFNKTPQGLTEMMLDIHPNDVPDSRIEIISENLSNDDILAWENALLDAAK